MAFIQTIVILIMMGACQARALSLGLPVSSSNMISRAAASCRAASHAGQKRLLVSIVVPLLPTVRPEDIDPWPGGLKQQFPVVKGLAQELLRQISAGEDGQCSMQVLSADDACALLVHEGPTPSKDMAAILFPGADHLADIKRVDAMVRRLLPREPRKSDVSLTRTFACFQRWAQAGRSF